MCRRHAGISAARLVIERENNDDRMTLLCEVSAGANEELEVAGRASLRKVFKLHGEVQFVTVGSLENDSEVIEDRRSYE